MAKVVSDASDDSVEIVKTKEKWSVPAGITAMLLVLCSFIPLCSQPGIGFMAEQPKR